MTSSDQGIQISFDVKQDKKELIMLIGLTGQMVYICTYTV
jgi:hypothetical protein